MPLCLKIKCPINNINNVKSTINKLRWDSKHLAKYVENITVLSTNIDLQSDIPIDDIVSLITSKIKQAAVLTSNKKIFEPKQKWFDWKCFRYRNHMLNALKHFRKNHTNVDKISYLCAKQKYKDCVTTRTRILQ
ncbi:hypothetical protein CVS40_11965 [Lucilia cuprina]|nr:hypothetical protein CVS40_11965 [Lucilia cuprina]